MMRTRRSYIVMCLTCHVVQRLLCWFVFFNDTATTEIYTLSLHDALPISGEVITARCRRLTRCRHVTDSAFRDRKSTRLNSSHANISYAVFCLKKKNTLLSYTFDQ